MTRITAIKSTDTGPGAITGAPSVEFTLRLTNGGSAPVGLDTVNVTATYGDATPASSTELSAGKGFTGSVGPGASTTASYAFIIPTDQRRTVQLQLSVSPEFPVVILSGSAA